MSFIFDLKMDDKENAVPSGARGKARRGLAPRDANKEPTQFPLAAKVSPSSDTSVSAFEPA